MGVYIKGMDMPTNCCECFAFKSNISGQQFCRAKRTAFGKEDAEWLPKRTPNWCPLEELPPHGDLVDRDELLGKDADVREDCVCDGYVEDSTWGFSRDTILREPVIIEAEGKDE